MYNDNYKIEMKFNSLWEEIFDVEDIKKTEVLHNKLEPADNTCSFSICPDEVLYNKLRNIGSKNVPVRITKNTEPYFYGYLRNKFTFKKTQQLQKIKIELVSPSFLLKKPIETAIVHENKTVKQLLGIVLHSAGITEYVLPNITKVLPAFFAGIEDEYHEVITALTFEYGFVFYFDKSGVFQTYKYIPNTITTTKEFNGSNILDSVEQEKTEEEIETVSVKYPTIVIKNDLIVFSDTSNAQTGNKCLLEIPPNAYMGDGSKDEWYANFDSPIGEIISCSGVTLDIKADSGIIVEKFEPTGDNRALVKIKNSNQVVSQFIRKLDIKASSVILKKDDNYSSTGLTTSSKKTDYESRYVIDNATADSLSSNILHYYKYSDFIYTLGSKTNYEIGDLVKVSEKGIGLNTCLIVEKESIEKENKYKYKLQAVNEYIPFIPQTRTEVKAPSITNEALEDINKSIEDVKKGTSGDVPNSVSSATAIVSQDGIEINILVSSDGSLDQEPVKYVYEISKDSGVSWTRYESRNSKFAHYFERSTDGYPEKTTGSKPLKDWRIRTKAVNVYNNESASYSEVISLNYSNYKTWIPSKPVIKILDANEFGLVYEIEYDASTFYGSGIRFDFTGTITKQDTYEKTGRLDFNRSSHGYPEKKSQRTLHNITTGTALDDYSITVTLKTNENAGTSSEVKKPTIGNYETWIPRLPSLALSVAGRKISLSIIPTNEVYGSIENRIQIRRYDEASYFALGNDDDAYTNETAYKQGAVNSYTPTFFNNYDQAVPLENQAAELPIDTSYYYRIQARQSGFSDPVYTTAWTAAKLAIAKATSNRDITANSIKQAQLANKAVTNRTIDDLAVDTDQLAIGAVVADRIASRTITAEQLSVVARSKINSFIHESDGLTGWNTGGEIVTVGSERALKLSSPHPYFLSDPFDVQPDELLEFSFGLQCSREAEASKGLYIGLTAGDTYELFTYSWTDKKWYFSSVGTWAYFVEDYRSSTKRFFTTYILGYNIDITTVPSPQFTDESYSVYCLKLSSGKTQTRIRSGYNPITTPTFWYLFSPQVYQVGAGKIVAKQIDVKNLSAVSSKLGEIQGDTADYKLVMGSGGSAEEGTFLLGSETDSAYLRRWKENGVWNMAIKLATFIIDAVSSKIKGVFEVQKTDGTPVFKMDPNTGRLTAPMLVGNVTGNLTGNVTGNLTGNASTATLATQALAIKPLGNAITLPATPTYVTKIIKIATVSWSYVGSINIGCDGNGVADGVKVYIGGGLATPSGIRVVYGKNGVSYGIKKIIVALDTPTWNSSRNIYAEIVNYPNDGPITTLGVVETNRGTFTPSMTGVPSITGTIVDSLSLDYMRGDISSYQHEFTKNIIGNLTGNLTGTPTAPTPATATNNTQIATTAFVKNQKYELNRGTGFNSLALGESSIASGDYSTALGRLSKASEDNSLALGDSSNASGIRSIALGRLSKASGDISVAIGYGAVAPRAYQITIGTKFVYLRFTYNETEATVYNALSPFVSPYAGYNQGSMGSFGEQEIVRLYRDTSTTIILVDNNNNGVKTIHSGNPNQIGLNFAICTVKY